MEMREGSRRSEDLVRVERAEEEISAARPAGRPATYALVILKTQKVSGQLW